MGLEPISHVPSRAASNLLITLVGAVASVAVLAVCLYGYVLLAGRNALNQTLIAQRDGTSLPANVVFDTCHLSVHMQSEGRFAAVLKGGFAVGRSTFLWDAPHALGASYSIDVNEDIGLVCEVYRGKTWRIFCGQLRCAGDETCRFEAAEAGHDL